MNSYYIARAGQQAGPFTLDELRSKGLRRDDMVWCNGMSQWAQAGSVSELAGLFPQYGQGRPQGNPQPRPNPYVQGSARARRSTGLLVMSILGIIASLIQLGTAAGMFIASASYRSSFYWNDDCYYLRSEMKETYIIAGVMLLLMGVFFLVLSIVGVVSGSRKTVRA